MYSFVELEKIKCSDFVIFGLKMTDTSYHTDNAYFFTYSLEKIVFCAILSMIFSLLF